MAPKLSWWVLTLIIALAEVSLGSDIRCTRKRGRCQNIYTATCAGYYDSSPICDGPAERQCCVPQPQSLRADTRCTRKRGRCQNINTATCAGYYDSSPICDGPAARQCCMPQPTSLDCRDFGNNIYRARGTAYYPDPSPMEGGYNDRRGNPLRTLQDYLAGRADYVSVAMDTSISYGTPVCIPELNRKYNRVVLFKVVDTGSAFRNKGYTRIDICVKNRQDSYDSTINGRLTLVFA